MESAAPERTADRHSALSELLSQIAEDESRERVSTGDLLAMAGDRAFGALIFVFALPNLVPTPPGTSAILGLPLIILSFQLLYGRRTPWLPKAISVRSIARSDLASVVRRTTPVLKRIERVLKPRLSWLVTAFSERLLALLMLILSVILFLPIPLGNIFPAAAMCIIALALIEHDGLAALFGVLIGAGSVLIVWGALLAVLKAILLALEHFAGV
ncbi:ABC transporter permease [Steroidobacter agaridevorans]|uniref:ABC transporter permease n=1 Tax=Steroidobacter agaridevorans TaxID=2695856 RepID=A0A829YJG8_9GAMM|nr:exopolysaccharide biosynthesis protein [Steroidobacter agaridevorans]GFE82993.1 ABC transporter permease [Steroidobacter agaridevorans]GFE86075.1 ABC transporter permease [Steroidobacter agaridevorans]